MSKKRQASDELHPENWDREEEPESCGTFRMATEDELKGRVIKRARRKINTVEENEDRGLLANKKPSLNADKNGSEVTTTGSLNSNSKSLFGNFQGFMKTSSTGTSSLSTPGTSSPFRFLSSLATKNTTSESSPLVSTPTTSATTTTSLNFKFTPDTSSKSMFSMPTNESDKNDKLSMDKPIIPKTMSFGGFNNISSPSSSIASSPITSLALMSKTVSFSMTTNSPTSTSTSKETDKYMKLSNSIATSPSPTTSLYYSKLKKLNQSVSEWIKQHVDKNPLCILTPIFNDYEKYLEEIEKEKDVKDGSLKSINETIPTVNTTLSNVKNQEKDCLFKMPLKTSSNSASNNQSSPFKSNMDLKTNGFSFGLKKSDDTSIVSGTIIPTSSPSSSTTITNQSSSKFTFGIKPVTENKSGDFSFLNSFVQSPGSDDSKKILNSTGFRFGNVAAPSSSSNTTSSDVVNVDDDENEDQPPKVEFRQVVEENAVFSKKCKVFVKKDNNFVDKGVGTLYLKPVDDSGKTQLLVRADTNLGNVLLNFILNDAIPTKRTGKNNVMIACMPTPEVTKATAVLLRVKTSEEADELLKVIDEHKK